MSGVGLGVTPELLTGAASAIDAALRSGDIGCVPAPVGGADYGHAGAGGAMSLFGSAVREATEALLAGSERASTGLRAGANAYLAQEQAALRAIAQEQAALRAIAREQTSPSAIAREQAGPGASGAPGTAGLAELMGLSPERIVG